MNIILGNEASEKLASKYTVLELDLFKFDQTTEPVPAFCVLELSTLEDLNDTVEKQSLHKQLIESYRSKSWDQCVELIESLYGSWSGEVDSFYDEIKNRVEKLSVEAPKDWDYVIDRTVKE